MPLLPDPGELDALAARVADHAAAARERAHQLGAAVAAAHWHGLAAAAFESEALVTIGALRSAAGRLDDAAAALRRHAERVRSVLDDLSPARLLAEGGDLVADGAQLVDDALDWLGF